MMKDNFKNIQRIIYEISPRKAEEELIKAEKTLTKNQLIELLMEIGAKYWTEDNIVDSKRLFKKILRLNLKKDDKAEAYEYLGRIAVDEGSYKNAIVLFKKALGVTKNGYLLASIHNGLSMCYYSIPDRKKSIYYAYQSLKHYDVKKKKERYDYYDNLETIVDNLLLMGEKEKADDIVRRYFKAKKIPKTILSNLHRSLGNYFYKRQDWVKALNNYTVALTNFDSTYLPSKGIILSYLGSCYMQLEDYNRAKAAYLQSLEYLSDDEDAKDKVFVKEELKIIDRNLMM